MKSIFMIFISNDNFKLNGPNLKHRENLQLFRYYLVLQSGILRIFLLLRFYVKSIMFKSKSIGLTISERIWFLILLNWCKCNFWKFHHNSRIVKSAFFRFSTSRKLISRKIWVVRKFVIFHTVWNPPHI